MTSDRPTLPDLTVTIPGALRRHVASRLTCSVVGVTTDPDRLRLAADLHDPALDDAARYSPAPVEDEHDPPTPITAVTLTEDEQDVIDGKPGAVVEYTDSEDDALRITVPPRRGPHGGLWAVACDSAYLSLEHQQRLHALLTVNLAKHGAL